MCFRPSAVAASKINDVQHSECPSCGQPIVSEAGVQSGECPYCGKPIPIAPADIRPPADPSQNAKIL